MKRKLLSGRKVEQQSEELPMTISSKCPQKWLFVDLETGDVWHVGKKDTKSGLTNSFQWRGATKEEMTEMIDVGMGNLYEANVIVNKERREQ